VDGRGDYLLALAKYSVAACSWSWGRASSSLPALLPVVVTTFLASRGDYLWRRKPSPLVPQAPLCLGFSWGIAGLLVFPSLACEWTRTSLAIVFRWRSARCWCSCRDILPVVTTTSRPPKRPLVARVVIPGHHRHVQRNYMRSARCWPSSRTVVTIPSGLATGCAPRPNGRKGYEMPTYDRVSLNFRNAHFS